MPPRNPSELQRLEEELEDLKKEWRKNRLRWSKAYLELSLQDIRKLERALDIPIEKWLKV
jgi:hypothetical protein